MNNTSEEGATNEGDGGSPEYPGPQYQGLIDWPFALFYVSIVYTISGQKGMNNSSEEDATYEGDGGSPEYDGQYQGLIIWYLALFYVSTLNTLYRLWKEGR